MTEHRTSVSKRMSHALRHAPEEYGLVLDDQGWVDISALIESIRQTWPQGGGISESMIIDIVRTSPKNRFEIRDGLIRARYGHSLTDSRIVNEEIVPNPVLFHATDPMNLTRILIDGLLPMGRQYVHMSVSEEAALEAGRRKTRRPVLLRIAALDAYGSGIVFFRGSDNISLAQAVPPDFLSVVSSSE